eukprot:4022516-Amphidinium_carterae.1
MDHERAGFWVDSNKPHQANRQTEHAHVRGPNEVGVWLNAKCANVKLREFTVCRGLGIAQSVFAHCITDCGFEPSFHVEVFYAIERTCAEAIILVRGELREPRCDHSVTIFSRLFGFGDNV